MPDTTLSYTIGDTPTFNGTIAQKVLGQLSDLTGCAVTFSLVPTTGGAAVIDNASATLVTLDAANNAIQVSYTTAPLATAAFKARVVWKLTMPLSRVMHFPGPDEVQTYVNIRP